MISFSHREHGSRRVLSEVKNALFRKLTARSSNLFVRGGDVISVGPQANSLHEPDLTSLIDHCCNSGYNEFLIDIGANIGLTTAQSGDRFSKIICFEPNPLCVHVLKVNIDIAGVAEKSEVREYGLGADEGEYELWIPRHNWGGAFVKSAQNSYSEALLLSKDGLSEFREDNYLIKKITVKPARLKLAEIFKNFSDDGLSNGVIKIDVEGMEKVVLRGVADALTPGIKIVILFENWSEDFDHKEIASLFHGRSISMFHLAYRKPFNKNWPRVLKAAALMIRPTELHLEGIEHSQDRTGDIVIVVD